MTELPDVLEEKREEIVALARRFGVTNLALFGSAVSGTFDRERSDVGVLVRFRLMQPAEHADAYFGLLHALEDLFSRRVDLLEEDAIENPYLRQSIDRFRQTLYAA